MSSDVLWCGAEWTAPISLRTLPTHQNKGAVIEEPFLVAQRTFQSSVSPLHNL